MVQDYIEDICNILNIPAPKVSYDTSHFHSLTNYFPLLMNCVIFGKSNTMKNSI